MFADSATLAATDPQIWSAITSEFRRQEEGIELIASENYTSPAVLAAQGSVLTNKYAEGYPGKRYYGGGEFVDGAQRLGSGPAEEIFRGAPGDAQPHPGAAAEAAGAPAGRPPGGPGPRPGPRRPPDARHAAELFRQILQGRQLRRHPGHPPHRLRPAGEGRPGAQAEAGHRRGERVPPAVRLRPVRRDLQGGRRAVHD